MLESINGNVDPILGFGIGASTGAVGNAFSITLTLPIALSGSITADSSISYTLTALTAAGAQLAPLFGKTLIAQSHSARFHHPRVEALGLVEIVSRDREVKDALGR
jgi:hypothetical protein